MAKTGFFHHIGTFLLFAAAILLLITTISSPVVNHIGVMKITLSNSTNGANSVVSFGTFGYCIEHASGNTDYCTGKHVGYNPAQIMEGIDNTDFNTASVDTSKALTRVMVLHPIACGLAFIAFLLAAGSGIIGAVAAAFLSAVAWIVTIVVMATDFVLFGIIKKHVNDDGSGSHAYFSVGMWTLLAAMICLFFATFIVLFTCCSSRMHRQNHTSSKHAETGYANGTTTTKRHFWQRRSRY
ncbi:pH-response regulator protein palI/prr-5 [Lachnellula suecica]|uniref:pH-response regulator protein palI/prr-5 n=1 Tax=Lachnellula suecica TaxID=602035 RepID=A0A8T9BYA2_9HELO|nr:pH-response regulator protein palI/prr-5 [Lachnellula suecica]